MKGEKSLGSGLASRFSLSVAQKNRNEIKFHTIFFLEPHQIERTVLTERTVHYVRSPRTVYRVRSSLLQNAILSCRCVDNSQYVTTA